MASDFYHTFFPRYSNHNLFTMVVVSYMCSYSCHGIQMQNTFFICIWTDRNMAVTTKHSLTVTVKCQTETGLERCLNHQTFGSRDAPPSQLQ